MDLKFFMLLFAIFVGMALAAKPTIDPKLKWHRPVAVPPQWYRTGNTDTGKTNQQS